MSREEIQKLLGGYATGTLTQEEQQALFEAALTDQELFDALAREEALREVLSDPASRARLLATIEEARTPWLRRWWRPLLPVTVALAVAVGVGVWQTERPVAHRMAKLDFAPPAPAPAPQLPPAPNLQRAAPDLAPYSLPAPIAQAVPPPPPPKQAGVAISSGTLVPREMLQSRFAPAANRVPVHGTVTDGAGTGIATAQVRVQSMATGETTTTSTDARGEFTVQAPAGPAYVVSASAPGFIPASANDVTSAEPVQLKLNLAPATQAAVVPQMARAGIAGAVPRAQAFAAALAPFEYRLFERTAGGELRELGADHAAAAGASLILRVTPYRDGALHVERANGESIANVAVRNGVAVDTPLPEFTTLGQVALRVYLTPSGAEAKQQAPAATITLNVR